MHDKMTTFTTRNRSRKRLYTLLCGGAFLLLIVAVIALYRRDKYRQMFKNVNLETRLNSAKLDSISRQNLDNVIRDKNRKTPATQNNQHNQYQQDKEPYYSSESIHRQIVTNVPHNGGPVRGQVRRLPNGKFVTSYLSIPYAVPPLGELRFESPKNLTSWTEIKDAFYQPQKCAQSSSISSISEVRTVYPRSSEDCLYLNIWTPYKEQREEQQENDRPKRKTKAKSSVQSKPVLVYFHSGLFHYGGVGSPDFDASNLTATNEIVVVTIQYRLGAFGFLSFAPNNERDNHISLGLQDQIKALEWVKKNIKAFGGNPEQITLVGHGAGAISIGYHLMNPNVNKLFKRVIVQGIDNIWNIGLYGLNTRSSIFLMDDLGCEIKVTNRELLKKCLAKLKLKQHAILETQQYLIEKFAVPFGPEFNPYTKELIQNKSQTEEILIEKLFANWDIFPSHIEFLIGINSDDDYQLEKLNHDNSEVSFEDIEPLEEEMEEEEEEEDAEETKKTDESREVENVESVPHNGIGDKKKEDLREKNEEEEEATEMEGESESDETENEKSPTSKTTKLMPKGRAMNSRESTAMPETAETKGLIQRRRRRRRKRDAGTASSADVRFDPDEIVKLCRLVKMYRLLKLKNSSSSSSSSTMPKIILYRIEPKILLNPLEQVSFVFDLRSNWLKQFTQQLTSLWSSFIHTGNIDKVDSELSQYQSKMSDGSSDTIELINLSQDSTETFGQIGRAIINLKQTCDS